MARMQLAELEDQPWLPATVRQGVTAYLNLLGNMSNTPYQEFCDTLARGMRHMGVEELVDLCSGSAGPLPTVLRELEQRGLPARARLTDLYPDPVMLAQAASQSGGRIDFEESSVDACAVPARLQGFRTLFNGFHHFPPDMAARILQDAVDQGRGIALFEGVEASAPSVLSCMLATVGVPIATLFIRPWSWSRAALTYLMPVIPFVTAFDGVVSCLRVYSVAELEALVAALRGGERYEWVIRRAPVAPGWGATWLVGFPR